jgi:hypothetical protein
MLGKQRELESTPVTVDAVSEPNEAMGRRRVKERWQLKFGHDAVKSNSAHSTTRRRRVETDDYSATMRTALYRTRDQCVPTM